MSHLVPCPGCNRHVRHVETHCPFCGAGLALSDVRAPQVPTTRLGRAALFTFSATLAGATALVACGGESESGDEDGGKSGSSTGGASTGGASTGGASTGGASTGGMAPGGASTGGTATGGASTGGFAGTLAPAYGAPVAGMAGDFGTGGG